MESMKIRNLETYVPLLVNLLKKLGMSRKNHHFLAAPLLC